MIWKQYHTVVFLVDPAFVIWLQLTESTMLVLVPTSKAVSALGNLLGELMKCCASQPVARCSRDPLWVWAGCVQYHLQEQSGHVV